MATTGELRAIIEELELIDIGDAASYLGEEDHIGEEAAVSTEPDWMLFGIAKRPVESNERQGEP